MSGMSVTDARAVRIAFTEPYLEAGLVAAVRSEDARRYASQDGVPPGAGVGGRHRADDRRRLRAAEASRTRGGCSLTVASDGALGLRRRTIDVFVHDAPSIAWLVSANEADLAGIWQFLNKEHLAWGVRRSDPQLLAQVNESLAAWRRDGTLAGVLARWLPYLTRPSSGPRPEKEEGPASSAGPS